MMQKSLYTFSLLLFLTITIANGQSKRDTTKISQPGGIQLYIDYGKLITMPSDFERKYEVGIAYQLRMGLSAHIHYGSAEINPAEAIENGTYSSSGDYWKAGIAYRLVLNQFNSLYIGGRYGITEFSDKGYYEITSTLWPTRSNTFTRSNLSADWFTFILGTEKILRDWPVILGATFGVRFINERTKVDFIDIYTIPGYGLAINKSSPFANLYLKIQF